MISNSQKDKKEIVAQDGDERFRSIFRSFLRNEHHTFVVQKTEKLASALYMVTGFIPGDDPLRTRLRTCAIELVSTSADPDKARDIRYQDGFASRCLEIGTILKLGERAGFISSMNAHILCDEYAELASFVKDHHDKVFGNMSIEIDDNKAKAALHTSVLRNLQQRAPAGLKDRVTVATTLKRTNDSKGHSNRRDIILRLLNKKDRITVKDAALAIEGCSEKTIQRELISLVQEGVLLKEGERRWSTYRKV